MSGPDMAAPTSIEDQILFMVERNAVVRDPDVVLSVDTRLWAVGMDSVGSVRLLVAVEEELDVEFTEELLTRETFDSVRSVARAVRTLRGETTGIDG